MMKEDMEKNILCCISISIKKGYLGKICEIFYVESSAKSGGSRRHCRIMLVIFKDNPGKKTDKSRQIRVIKVQ